MTRRAPVTHVAPHAAPVETNPFVALLPTTAPAPAVETNPFVSLLAAARAEADAAAPPPSVLAQVFAYERVRGDTRVGADGRRQWLLVCSECGWANCYLSRWVSE